MKVRKSFAINIVSSAGLQQPVWDRPGITETGAVGSLAAAGQSRLCYLGRGGMTLWISASCEELHSVWKINSCCSPAKWRQKGSLSSIQGPANEQYSLW